MPQAAPSATPKSPDVAADALFDALKRGDFRAAESSFDERLRTGLPEEKLREVWGGIRSQLGALQAWDVTERAQRNGNDVRTARLSFERGEVEALVASHSDSGEVASLFFKPLSAPKPAAPYVDPTAFHAEEVSVGSEPFVLSATLTVPAGAGPFPGVVLVHGSGPSDRNEAVGGNQPFRNLAEGLSSRGVAVLRYDKRTFRYREQIADGDISIDNEVIIDAIAAVQELKRHSEVDKARVFVIGHSLGAQLAPEIALRSAPIAGVVLLAPPGRPPLDALAAQLRFLGAAPEKIAEIEEASALLKAGKLGERKLLGVPGSYWADWASRDGVAMAQKLRKPSLVLRGDRDYQVIDDDIEAWRRGLRGQKGVEFVTLEGDNHLFIRGTGKPNPAEYQTPGFVDERVIDLVAQFVTKR
ncbi:MAG: alpha/beta fold hydrolase [Polyangiaceae bacterium]